MYEDMKKQQNNFYNTLRELNDIQREKIGIMRMCSERILELGIRHMKNEGYMVTDVTPILVCSDGDDPFDSYRYIVHKNNISITRVVQNVIAIIIICTIDGKEFELEEDVFPEFDVFFPGYGKNEENAWENAINIHLPIAVPEPPDIVWE